DVELVNSILKSLNAITSRRGYFSVHVKLPAFYKAPRIPSMNVLRLGSLPAPVIRAALARAGAPRSKGRPPHNPIGSPVRPWPPADEPPVVFIGVEFHLFVQLIYHE